MYIALDTHTPPQMFLSPKETEECTLIKSPQSFREFADRYTSALIDTARIIKDHQKDLQIIWMRANDNDSTLGEVFYNITGCAKELADVLGKADFDPNYIKIACKEFRDGVDYPMANATLVADLNDYMYRHNIAPPQS